MTTPSFDNSFPHSWTAEVLPRRPLILPTRQYVYPAAAEEVERGALELLIQPKTGPQFLATCALGFRDPAAPTGLWSCPHPDWLCALSGGYAYLLDTAAPERFVFLRYRPVLNMLPSPAHQLLLFAGHISILAWGPAGQAWESERLSAEGLSHLRIEGDTLRGQGWDLRTDKDIPFTLDLRTGQRL